MKSGQARFDALKEKLGMFHFQFGKLVKNEKCTVLLPLHWEDFICGEDNTFLAGEVTGFINVSSPEGVNYTLDSAKILRSVPLRDAPDMNRTYRKAICRLRLRLYGKVLESRALTLAFSRKWITRSGVTHIPRGGHSAP